MTLAVPAALRSTPRRKSNARAIARNERILHHHLTLRAIGCNEQLAADLTRWHFMPKRRTWHG